MALELDTRQRAMLLEMGVHVWLPEAGVAAPEEPVQPQPAPAAARSAPAPSGAAGTQTASTTPLQRPFAREPATLPVAPALPDWSALAETVRTCRACSLCAGRSHATLLPPTEKQSPCDWLVLGDPPDEDEDRTGTPFAGSDGVLLSNMLRALGLQRANPGPSASPAAALALQSAPAAQRAYVTHVLKCRPAHGAMPQAAELAHCAGYLQQEIALVQPKMMIAMGRFANQLLLSETPAMAALPLGKLRGTVHRYQGVAVVLTYAPRQLMRNGADKAKAWADLCLAAATLEA